MTKSAVLITGFEPFGEVQVNPSWEAVRCLPDKTYGITLHKLLLPTAFIRAEQKLLTVLRELRPAAVILTGLAGGREEISLERVAINLRDARIPDNDGYAPQEEEVVPGGPAAYFSSLPVRSILKTMKDIGIPCRISLSAGSYVCNDVFYTLMHFAASERPDLPGGFIHVPYLPGQVPGKPCLPLETIAEGLTAAVKELASVIETK